MNWPSIVASTVNIVRPTTVQSIASSVHFWRAKLTTLRRLTYRSEFFFTRVSAGASGGDRGACPYRKLAPMSDCTRRPIGGLPVLRMLALLERLYSTRTTMKQSNFSRRFDKPDLNFQKVYTHSQSSGHIRI